MYTHIIHFKGGCKQIGFISNRIKGHFCGVFVNLYIVEHFWFLLLATIIFFLSLSLSHTTGEENYQSIKSTFRLNVAKNKHRYYLIGKVWLTNENYEVQHMNKKLQMRKKMRFTSKLVTSIPNIYECLVVVLVLLMMLFHVVHHLQHASANIRYYH